MEHDTTVTKIESKHSPRGPEGERYLASGVRVSMRLWDADGPGDRAESTRRYEVVGYVLKGRAELHIEGQLVLLQPGDSYVVPAAPAIITTSSNRSAPTRQRHLQRTSMDVTSLRTPATTSSSDPSPSAESNA